jgi:hypothetical protein
MPKICILQSDWIHFMELNLNIQYSRVLTIQNRALAIVTMFKLNAPDGLNIEYWLFD